MRPAQVPVVSAAVVGVQHYIQFADGSRTLITGRDYDGLAAGAALGPRAHAARDGRRYDTADGHEVDGMYVTLTPTTRALFLIDGPVRDMVEVPTSRVSGTPEAPTVEGEVRTGVTVTAGILYRTPDAQTIRPD